MPFDEFLFAVGCVCSESEYVLNCISEQMLAILCYPLAELKLLAIKLD